jgi:hypothetical protein
MFPSSTLFSVSGAERRSAAKFGRRRADQRAIAVAECPERPANAGDLVDIVSGSLRQDTMKQRRVNMFKPEDWALRLSPA